MSSYPVPTPLTDSPQQQNKVKSCLAKLDSPVQNQIHSAQL